MNTTLSPHPFNVTNTGLQIQLRCTLAGPGSEYLEVPSQHVFLKADLECCHRRDRHLGYYLALIPEDETDAVALFNRASLSKAVPFERVRCRRIIPPCKREANDHRELSQDTSLLLPLMIYRLRGIQTPKSVIPQPMKFVSTIDFDGGDSLYELFSQEGGDYGRGYLAQQGLSRYSTNVGDYFQSVYTPESPESYD